jgi:hypothetical protein
MPHQQRPTGTLLQVVSGFDLLAGPDCMVEALPNLGLAVIRAPEPLHSTSLFSHSIGCDVVVSAARRSVC